MHAKLAVFLLFNILVNVALKIDAISIVCQCMFLLVLNYHYVLLSVAEPAPDGITVRCAECRKATPQHYVHCRFCKKCVPVTKNHYWLVQQCASKELYQRYLGTARACLLVNIMLSILASIGSVYPLLLLPGQLFFLKSTYDTEKLPIYVQVS